MFNETRHRHTTVQRSQHNVAMQCNTNTHTQLPLWLPRSTHTALAAPALPLLASAAVRAAEMACRLAKVCRGATKHLPLNASPHSHVPLGRTTDRHTKQKRLVVPHVLDGHVMCLHLPACVMRVAHVGQARTTGTFCHDAYSGDVIGRKSMVGQSRSCATTSGLLLHRSLWH